MVLVNPWGIDAENICECKSYVYRGSCKHQVIAHQQICRWNERDGLEVQAVSQEKSKTCPRCGGPTRIQIEVDNE